MKYVEEIHKKIWNLFKKSENMDVMYKNNYYIYN